MGAASGTCRPQHDATAGTRIARLQAGSHIMVIRGLWLIALTAGAGLLLAASARADDLQDLKLGRATGFTHNDRGPVAGYVEDINFRCWLGYWRGSNNIGYIARFNAFRTGHADGTRKRAM